MRQKLDVVSTSLLFDMLSNAELAAVAELCRPLRFEKGQVVFEEGDLGDSLYVIASGEVEILQRPRGSSKPEVIAELVAPDFFGEMSVIDKEYRSATVRAKTETELLNLSAEDLTSFRQANPDGFTMVVLNIARMLAARLRDANHRIGPLPGKGGV